MRHFPVKSIQIRAGKQHLRSASHWVFILRLMFIPEPQRNESAIVALSGLKVFASAPHSIVDSLAKIAFGINSVNPIICRPALLPCAKRTQCSRGEIRAAFIATTTGGL
jgi:hypothetical protein